MNCFNLSSYDRRLILQVSKNDGLSESICQLCWTITRTFHNFYRKVELIQKGYWNSFEKECRDADDGVGNETNSDLLKEERGGHTEKEGALEPDLNIVKFEEPPLEVFDIQISKDESSDYNDANCCDRSNFFLNIFVVHGPVSTQFNFF